MRSLAVLVALLAVTAHAETITGTVLNIFDGDMLTLVDASRQQHKIHLAGIDAPHITQDFGQKSRSSLSALAFNQQAVARCPAYDRQQHASCVVAVGGRDLGLEQLVTGMAWFRQDSAPQTANERADYAHAELNAKLRRRGLWNSRNPTPPWNWRHVLPAE
jgi:endonuclease YncB( thermonuclease family)